MMKVGFRSSLEVLGLIKGRSMKVSQVCPVALMMRLTIYLALELVVMLKSIKNSFKKSKLEKERLKNKNKIISRIK